MELGQSALEREIDRGIDKIFKTKPELARALRNHPRKPRFVENLGRELQHADNRLVLKSGVDTLAKTIFEMTKTYCKVALESMEQEAMSQNERTRRVDEANRIKNAEEIVKEAMPNLDIDDFKVAEATDV